ncbi:GNAT family N-acetyltransferase [Mycolicibacterium sp.]|jgi:L-amino acid N-acyltransferase YncA|uniref:GNAT family N-acetyltransferase n=1 Tax=Mycolicibacterium sp. TaxID=2320850 RepID=UPI0028AF46C3|nr:GNAT family N-acetyltransferase [Mycolicibacterium sp.]
MGRHLVGSGVGTVRARRAGLERPPADSSTHVLVCERPAGSIAACAFVQITEETAYFGGLYVEDVGRGLGTMLVTERLRIARESGARTALMLVRQTNEPARNHAEKAGFSVVGEKPCQLVSTVPRLVYAMALDAPALVPA